MNTTKQIATTKKVDTRLLAILTALCMVLGIVPIMVSAEEVAYHTQGNELCIYLDTSDEVVTEDSVTEYYYNIIKTPKLADQDMVFKIALGKAPGINNQTAILQNGNVKVYSSNDLKATPFYTVPNNAIVSTAKNDFWPEAGYQAGRNGRTHTITIPANTLSADTTYYLVVEDVGSEGSQGTGTVGKRTVFQFTTAPAGTVSHTCTSFEHHDAKAAEKCTDGYEEYWQCADPTCGKMYSDANGQNEITRPTPIAAQHHFEVIYAKEATCTEMGYNVVGGNGLNHCLDCGKYFKNNGAEMAKEEVELPALGHDFKDGKCTRCGTADSTPTHTHSWETVPAVESTCTDTGLTEGIRCSECGEWQKEQTVVPKKAHTPETIAAVSPTCTEDGKTEGKKCAVCGTVLEEPKTITKLGHKYVNGVCERCNEKDPDYKPTPVEPVSKFTGLANEADKDGNWWYYTDGKIDTTHNGVDNNKYGWWRVENGKVNFNAQGIYQNSFGWWKTTNGKVTFKEEGVFQNNFGWWRVKDSKVDFNAQSIYQNKFGWWKTTNGKVTFKENGLFSNQYGTWKVENSKVNFNFNGKYQGKTIKNGKVV